MYSPYFSIIIPTRGRPKYLRDAVTSALHQNFDDFEVVVSDNYNDAQTKVVLDEFCEDPKFRCVRTDRLLNMPDHWAFATQHAKGKYVLILTDRSVLKQGTLKVVYEGILSSGKQVEACSWRWSLYDDVAGRECANGFRFEKGKIVSLDSRRIAEEFSHGTGGGTYCLPKGLNSCYEKALMQRICDEFGSPFRPLSPDYFSAFAILATAQEVLYLDDSYVIFQGNADSNGGRGIAGIDTGYLNALGECDFYAHVPIKRPLVKNFIYEDFLRAQELCGGNLEGLAPDWVAYFSQCYYELLIKQEAGLLSKEVIDELFCEWGRVLETFGEDTQEMVGASVEVLKNNFQFPEHLSWVKGNGGGKKPGFGKILKNILFHSKLKYRRRTALEVAGFSSS